MKAVIFKWEGDDSIIEDYIKRFNGFSDSELIEAYKREAKMGIVGVHQQHLYLIALRKVMLERFGSSPVNYEYNLLGFK